MTSTLVSEPLQSGLKSLNYLSYTTNNYWTNCYDIGSMGTRFLKRNDLKTSLVTDPNYKSIIFTGATMTFMVFSEMSCQLSDGLPLHLVLMSMISAVFFDSTAADKPGWKSNLFQPVRQVHWVYLIGPLALYRSEWAISMEDSAGARQLLLLLHTQRILCSHPTVPHYQVISTSILPVVLFLFYITAVPFLLHIYSSLNKLNVSIQYVVLWLNIDLPCCKMATEKVRAVSSFYQGWL